MSEELKARLRQARRRRELPLYIPRLERALGISLVEADFLETSISEGYVVQYWQFILKDFTTHAGSLLMVRDPEHADDIWDIVASTLPQIQGLNTIFLLPTVSPIGTMTVTAEVILRRAAEIMHDLNVDLNLFTPDLASGFCLELNHFHDPVGRDEYELKAWGQFVPAPA